MSHYWASFRRRGGHLYRFDTRIYPEGITAPREDDKTLGCIVGKNPGSAAGQRRGEQLTPIVLAGDKFLPTVLSVLRKSHQQAGTPLPARGYLQVLNLFYLCNRDLREAKKSLLTGALATPCITEGKPYPWVWYAWGGPDALLDPFKSRFAQLESNARFFFDGRARCVLPREPQFGELAKHTQGMPQSAVVAHLANLINHGV